MDFVARINKLAFMHKKTGESRKSLIRVGTIFKNKTVLWNKVLKNWQIDLDPTTSLYLWPQELQRPYHLFEVSQWLNKCNRRMILDPRRTVFKTAKAADRSRILFHSNALVWTSKNRPQLSRCSQNPNLWKLLRQKNKKAASKSPKPRFRQKWKIPFSNAPQWPKMYNRPNGW